MGVIKLKNTLSSNLFIESISRNVVPGGHVMLSQTIIDTDHEIQACINNGMLKEVDAEPQVVETPKDVDPSKAETKEMDRSKMPKAAKAEVKQEPESTATVATGDGTRNVKPMKSANMPLPDWLPQDQLRRSEAAAREYDASEGNTEEWRITDDGIEKKISGSEDVVSSDGVTTRAASNPAPELTEPIKIGRVKRTGDSVNDDPMIQDENSGENYSGAFVTKDGEKPDAGYGKAFID